MKSLFPGILGLLALCSTRTGGAEPLKIDLTRALAPAADAPYGPGTTKNPRGQELVTDNRSLILDGKPWLPVLGEICFSRYPREEWRDALLKMKSGGLDSVSTTVFWTFHEEERGKFDWSGRRSLRDFIKLCKELDLKMIVRIQPVHGGEVRNQGTPDWVEGSGTGLRTADPAYIKLLEPFWRETAKQMEGLLWKDGGPVIGIQVSNESDHPPLLIKLKELARSYGIDVPFYFMTGWQGWQGGMPKEGFIPVFGEYSDGYWGGTKENYRGCYFFGNFRGSNVLNDQLQNTQPADMEACAKFPFVCLEVGCGMLSSYAKRPRIDFADCDSIAVVKLGNGSNLQGYCLYQGGDNPDGNKTYVNLEGPGPFNQVPVKDYDFQAPLGTCGQVRDHYHFHRKLNFLLHEFGPQLARMPAYFPEKMPANNQDYSTLRWNMRSDGNSGFLFLCNQQPYFTEKKDVQFQVQTKAGPVLFPSQPINIPVGINAIWPVNLDCDGVMLDHATAQAMTVVRDQGEAWYFLAAHEGFPVEMSFACDDAKVQAASGVKIAAAGHVVVRKITPGSAAAVSVTKPDGRKVHFVVLAPAQTRQFYRVRYAGQDRALLTAATVLEDGALRMQAATAENLAFAFFPAPPSVKLGDLSLKGTAEGIFTRFVPRDVKVPELPKIAVTLEKAADLKAPNTYGPGEEAWKDAAIYKLDIPSSAAKCRLILDIHYKGDVARVYAGGKLFADNFSNGDPLSIALWRIPVAEWPTVQLKVLPAKPAAATMEDPTVSATDQIEVKIHP
ncbi:MAG: beta-galactosidase [Verrucomicrobia bacterium]|nr:beta-galactosidase [Verrucomicrobiota bacterium]